MDFLSDEKRSALMATIRGRGNKSTELVLASMFRRLRISGWRRHVRLIGQPDFVFRKAKVIVFVDGCFWHGCPRHYRKPTSNRAFWNKKILANKTRDRVVNKALRACGWRVIRLWEHELVGANHRKVRRLFGQLLGDG